MKRRHPPSSGPSLTTPPASRLVDRVPGRGDVQDGVPRGGCADGKPRCWTSWIGTPNAHVAQFGRFGALSVRHGKASKGSGTSITVTVELWRRPCFAVVGTRCTRCVPTMPATRRTSKLGSDLDGHNTLERHYNRVGRSVDGRAEFDRERGSVGTTGTGMDLEGWHHAPRLGPEKLPSCFLEVLYRQRISPDPAPGGSRILRRPVTAGSHPVSRTLAPSSRVPCAELSAALFPVGER